MNEEKSTLSSYRIDPTAKDKIKEQMEQMGLTQRVYFDKVVSLMELENVKQNDLFKIDTTELQDLTQRIYNLFIGLCDQGNSFLSNKDTELQELKTKYKDMLSQKESCITLQSQELQSVHERINVLQEENKRHDEMNEKIKADKDKQLGQLQQSIQDKENLITEYKGKIDTLSSIATEYKAYADTNKELEQTVNNLDKTIDTLTNDNKGMNDKIEQLKEQLQTENNKHQEQIDQLKELKEDKINQLKEQLKDNNDKHQEQIQQLKQLDDDKVKQLKQTYEDKIQQQQEKLELQKDKAILQLDKQHQEQIKKQQEEYNNKVKELLLQLENKDKEVIKN